MLLSLIKALLMTWRMERNEKKKERQEEQKDGMSDVEEEEQEKGKKSSYRHLDSSHTYHPMTRLSATALLP